METDSAADLYPSHSLSYNYTYSHVTELSEIRLRLIFIVT